MLSKITEIAALQWQHVLVSPGQLCRYIHDTAFISEPNFQWFHLATAQDNIHHRQVRVSVYVDFVSVQFRNTKALQFFSISYQLN